MKDESRPMTAEIEMVRKAYAALNKGDVEGFVADFDPQIVRVEFEGLPIAGTYRGLDDVRAHVVKGRGTWAEGACEPQKFIAVPDGGRVIVLAHVHVRLKQETEWREGDLADGYTFRNGKVIEFRTFAEKAQAFEWAGLQTFADT